MKNEAEFKSAFKKSVKAQGGFAISLAAPMLAGIPDLYVIMPRYAPLLVEAKWFGEISGPHIQRKIPYTKMQLFYLNEINKIKDYTALGLMGFKRRKEYWCTLVHPRFEYIDNINIAMDEGIFCVAQKKLFDIAMLLQYYPIPKLNGIGAHAST